MRGLKEGGGGDGEGGGGGGGTLALGRVGNGGTCMGWIDRGCLNECAGSITFNVVHLGPSFTPRGRKSQVLNFNHPIMNATADTVDSVHKIDAEAFLRKLTGTIPQTSIGWFRAGVGFFRKRYHSPAVQCLEKAVALDPMNYEAWQVLARAYVLQNRRKDAITALKKSVKLNNAADWQMLVELTNLEEEQQSKKEDD
jgi:hypothetical protein